MVASKLSRGNKKLQISGSRYRKEITLLVEALFSFWKSQEVFFHRISFLQFCPLVMMNSSIRVAVWLICIIVVLHSSSTVFSKEKSSLHHGLYPRQWRDICLHTRCNARRRSSRGKKRHFRKVSTAFDAILYSFVRNKSQRKEWAVPFTFSGIAVFFPLVFIC